MCNVTTLRSNNKHKLGFSNSLSNLHSVIPTVSGFDDQYANPCWHSGLHLESAMAINRCKSERRTRSKIIHQEQALIDKIEGLRESDSHNTSLVCLPRLFLPGFPKSGSTQLFKLLSLHPLVQPGSSKEPHWWTRFPFSPSKPFDKLSVFAYLKHFSKGSKCSQADSRCMTVDASQSLVWDSSQTSDVCMLPQLLQAVLPATKFIITMREPGHRLYSAYWYFSQKSGEKKIRSPEHFHLCIEQAIHRFNACLKAHSLPTCVHRYQMSGILGMPCGRRVRLTVGVYYIHIRKWLRFFPEENFLFLRLEDLASNPIQLLTRVWDFLGLPYQNSTDLEDAISTPRRQQSYPPMLLKTEHLLRQLYAPYNEQLSRLLRNEKFLWSNSVHSNYSVTT